MAKSSSKPNILVDLGQVGASKGVFALRPYPPPSRNERSWCWSALAWITRSRDDNAPRAP